MEVLAKSATLVPEPKFVIMERRKRRNEEEEEGKPLEKLAEGRSM